MSGQNALQVPGGHGQVSPYVMVPDGPAFIAFLQETFGAQPGTIVRSANGKKIIHGEIRLGDSLFFFADGMEQGDDEGDDGCAAEEREREKGAKQHGTGICEPSNIHMYVYVGNAAETMERAERAGGTPVMPAADDADGQMGGFLDPFHNLWWVKSFKGET